MNLAWRPLLLKARLYAYGRLVFFVVGVLSAQQSPAAASISVNVVQPTGGAVLETSLDVIVTVTSIFQVSTVTAVVDGQQFNLSFFPQGYCAPSIGCVSTPSWLGSLSIQGFTSGSKVLTVTATDVFGSTGSSSVTFVHDRSPVLTLLAPLDDMVARPNLRVTATCLDDDPSGCVSMSVAIGGTIGSGLPPVATGTSSIDQNISLAAYDGASITIVADAFDSAGRRVVVTRRVHVESSTRLSEIDQVGGPILDATADRILFQEVAAGGTTLKLRDRMSGVDTAVFTVPAAGTFLSASLTPLGALFVARTYDCGPAFVYEWRGGTVLTFGEVPRCQSVDLPKVKGNYAAWTEMTGTMFLRDVVADVTTSIGNGTVTDVGAQSDVVLTAPGPPVGRPQVFRYRGGITSALTADTHFFNGFAVTDGVNVVFLKYVPQSSLPDLYSIMEYGNAGEVSLTPVRSAPGDVLPSAGRDYQAAGGWIAFTDETAPGLRQIWLRSPLDVQTQISFFSQSSRIDSLAPDGELTFTDGAKRYIAAVGTPALAVSSALGRSFKENGEWYVILGRSLFRVTDRSSCAYTASPSSLFFTAAGGTGSASIGAQSGCLWAASSSDPWATVTPASGSGAGTVTYTLASHLGTAPRSATLTIAGYVFKVTQASAGPVTLTLQTTGAGTGVAGTAAGDLACGTSCSKSYSPGTVVRLVARPASGSVFAGWAGDVDCHDGSVTMTLANQTCVAVFSVPVGSRATPGSIDLNGDGRGDAFTYDGNGAWSMELSDGSGSFAAVKGSWSPEAWRIWPADFDGNGLTDFFLYNEYTGQWFKATNGGASFSYFTSFWSPWWQVHVMDLDGDGRSDVFVYDGGLRWFKCITQGPGDFFYHPGQWSSTGWEVHPLNLDGNGAQDLFLYHPTTGQWFRAINDGAASWSYSTQSWSPGWGLYPGDFNGDGLFDLFLYNEHTGQWFVASNNGTTFTYHSELWSPGWSIHVADFDANDVSDLFLYNDSTGQWFVVSNQGASGFSYSTGFWSPGWQVFITDLDGDRRSDVLIYDGSSGAFFQCLTRAPGLFSYLGGSWSRGLAVVAVAGSH